MLLSALFGGLLSTLSGLKSAYESHQPSRRSPASERVVGSLLARPVGQSALQAGMEVDVVIASTFWSDFILTLFTVALSVLYAMNYPGEAKKKPRRTQCDYKQQWEEL